MTTVKITGDFSFNPHNIKSMVEFNFTLRLEFEPLSKEQHLFIRQKISEALNLRPHDIPQPWGDTPVRYEELNFETHPQDYARFKSIIGILKEGNIQLTANGYRYPPDTDHPLMASIHRDNDFHQRFPNFQAFQVFILDTFEETRQLSAHQTHQTTIQQKTNCRSSQNNPHQK